jgi:hypothetical protein
LETLGDSDDKLQEEYQRRYHNFQEMGFFDAVLPSNSSKQAVANLLTMLDINEYSFPSQKEE